MVRPPQAASSEELQVMCVDRDSFNQTRHPLRFAPHGRQQNVYYVRFLYTSKLISQSIMISVIRYRVQFVRNTTLALTNDHRDRSVQNERNAQRRDHSRIHCRCGLLTSRPGLRGGAASPVWDQRSTAPASLRTWGPHIFQSAGKPIRAR